MSCDSTALYDVLARIDISTTVPDPKNRGVRTGYMPHHKFANIDYLASGRHYYEDDEPHYPGETLLAKIKFPSWEFMRNDVRVDDSFEIRELDRVVGYGTVLALRPRSDPT